jgi:ABC-type nitrate/sulfonate/bicarbonate transport system substrate-binding protein
VPAPVKYTLGRIGNATFQSPFYVGVNKGFLQEQGLDPEIVQTPTREQIAALVSGTMDVSVSSTDTVLLALARGQPLRQVMGYQSKWPYNLLGQPQYKRPEDLRGTVIGVEGYNLSSGRMTELFLKRYGLERERDYDLVVAGNSAERYAALVNGSVSAALLTDPGSFLLIDQGFSNLGALEDALPRMEFEGWTVNANTARQAPDALVAFLRGMVKTYQWLYDPANKEELLRIYREEYKLEPKIAEQAYAANVPGKMWNENGRIDRAAMQVLIDDMRQNNDFEGLPVPTVDQVVDEGPLRQAWTQLGIQP